MAAKKWSFYTSCSTERTYHWVGALPSSTQSAARQCNLEAHEDAGLESVADCPRTLLRYFYNVANFVTTSRRWQRTSANRLCKESVVLRRFVYLM